MTITEALGYTVTALDHGIPTTADAMVEGLGIGAKFEANFRKVLATCVAAKLATLENDFYYLTADGWSMVTYDRARINRATSTSITR